MSNLKQLMGVKGFVEKEAKRLSYDRHSLEKKLSIEEQVQTILEKLAEKSSEARLSTLLRAGIKFTYGSDYKFTRDGKDLLVSDSSAEADLFEGRGGGLVDIVALLLRILALKRGKGGRLQTLILDEPLRCSSASSQIQKWNGKRLPMRMAVRDVGNYAVESVDLVTGKVKESLVTKGFKNGKSEDWYRLDWGTGRSHGWGYFTGDHSFYRNGDKVEVQKLGKATLLDAVIDELSEDLNQCLLGTFLGDSSVLWRSDCKHALAVFEQGDSALNYLKWKVGGLIPILGKLGRSRSNCHKYQKVHSVFDRYADVLKVRRGHKVIAVEWLQEMQPLAFAVWYMDDGYYSSDGNIQISCSNFGYCGAQEMCRVLNTKFGIDASIYSGSEQRTKNKQDWVKIFIGKKFGNAKRFLDLVRSFIHPDYSYKDPQFSGGVPQIKSELVRTYKPEFLPVSVKYVGKHRECMRYAIEVEGTHNYVLPGGLLSSNCVDRETALKASEFINALCDKLDINVLMTTHRQELEENADRVYVIDKVGGVTRVRRRN